MMLQLIDHDKIVYWAKTIDIMSLRIDVIELGELLDKFMQDLKKLEIVDG